VKSLSSNFCGKRPFEVERWNTAHPIVGSLVKFESQGTKSSDEIRRKPSIVEVCRVDGHRQ
jgi:hypothetical protein